MINSNDYINELIDFDNETYDSQFEDYWKLIDDCEQRNAILRAMKKRYQVTSKDSASKILISLCADIEFEILDGLKETFIDELKEILHQEIKEMFEGD